MIALYGLKPGYYNQILWLGWLPMFQRLILTRTTTVCHPAPLKTNTCWLCDMASRFDWENCRCPHASNSGAPPIIKAYFWISSLEAHQLQPRRVVTLKGGTLFLSVVLWKWHANLFTCTCTVIDLGNTKNTIGSCQRPSLWIIFTVQRAKSLKICFLPVKG